MGWLIRNGHGGAGSLGRVSRSRMVALVLAGEAQRKFGGDSVTEFVRNAEAFTASLS